MRSITLWTATLATLGCMNVAEAQDTYYEYLTIESDGLSDLSVSKNKQTPISADSGNGVFLYDTAFSAGKIWFIAGWEKDGTATNKINVLHKDTLEYEEITTTGDSFSARFSVAAAATESNVYFFGGAIGADDSVDHLFSIGSTDYVVTDLTAASNPPARSGSAMTSYGENLLLFGGQDNNGDLLSDLWQFDTATGSWEELTPASGSISARMQHCMTVLGDKLYVFGERTSIDEKLYTYDLSTSEWSSAEITPRPIVASRCSLIGAQHTNEEGVASDFLYMLNGDDGVTAIDVENSASDELVKSGFSDVYEKAVIFGTDQIMSMRYDGEEIHLMEYTISKGGFFSSPAGIALISAIAAAAVGAAVYFLVIKP